MNEYPQEDNDNQEEFLLDQRAKSETAAEENLVAQGSVMNNIKALLIKRMHIYKRDKIGLVCEIIVPVLLVILGLILSKVAAS